MMDVTAIPQMVRNSGRFKEVATVLAKYGLVGWMSRVHLDWIDKLFRAEQDQHISELPFEERVRLALTELGTTFVKLGQILSTRPDLVGPELAEELQKLQSATPADPPELVREVLQAELGKSPEELFASFENDAMASASIAQIHAATTHEGQQVVVKVQHHNIEAKINNDLEILQELARLAEHFSPQLRPMQPLATAREFGDTLRRELDFGREARNLKLFAHNFAKNPGIRFPTPYPDLSAKRVLTMDRLEGTSLGDTEELERSGWDLAELALRGANMFVEMIFRDGFYHADPHPGNLMVLRNGALGVLDCGMVGHIDEELREQIEDMLLAAVDQDARRLTDVVVQLGQLPGDFDEQALQSEIDQFVVDFRDQSLDQFDLSGALRGIVQIIRSHHIILPARIALLLKVLIMLEGTAQQLSPGFSLAELLKPYRAKAMQRRLSPQRMWRKLQTSYREWNHLIGILPGDLADILRRIKKGSFDVHLDHRRLDATINRMVMGIMTAALWVGSATLWAQNVPPRLGEYSIPGALGCLTALFLGWRIVRAIHRSGDMF